MIRMTNCLLKFSIMFIWISIYSCNENLQKFDKINGINSFSGIAQLNEALRGRGAYNIKNYLRISRTKWIPTYLKQYPKDSLTIKLMNYPWYLRTNSDTTRIFQCLTDTLLLQTKLFHNLLIKNLNNNDSCYSSYSQYSSFVRRMKLSTIGNECLMILSNSKFGNTFLESPDKESFIDSLKNEIRNGTIN